MIYLLRSLITCIGYLLSLYSDLVDVSRDNVFLNDFFFLKELLIILTKAIFYQVELFHPDLFYLTTTSADEIHDGMNLELYYQ